jgi:teichoic acid transport system ATP-binding protein
VGDRQFKRRSAKRIDEIRANAGTIFLVSHNLTEVRNSCTRGIWLDHGQMIMDGPVDEVVDAYERRDDATAATEG